MARHHHIARIHKKKPKEPFDFLVYFFTVATPLFEIPQAVAIYTAKSAENVPLLTWVFFLFADVVWLVYAIRNKLVPLALTYLLYLIVEIAIVGGILVYS
ncbi:MAG: PQ-loop domain-containing transporter [Patescibacteria group bacterium]